MSRKSGQQRGLRWLIPMTHVVIGGICLLPLHLGAQPEPEAIKQPPSWPSPQDYLAEKRQKVKEAKEAKEANRSRAQAVEPTNAPGLTAASPAYPEQSLLPPFTVQIAAFRDYGRALEAVRAADSGGLAVLRSRRDEETWHVVVLGLYATREAAAAAEASYLSSHPGAVTWLRSTATLSVASGADGG